MYENAKIYLTTKWIDIFESTLLFTNVEKVATYEKLLKYFDMKNKNLKLWIIFEIIENVVDVFALYEKNDKSTSIQIKKERSIIIKRKIYDEKKTTFHH